MSECSHHYDIVNTFTYEKEMSPINVLAGNYKVKRTQVVKKCKKCEDVFEEEEVVKIIISKLHDSGTSGCQVPERNPVVVVYEFNRYMYYYKFFLEKNVYSSLEEAVSSNKKAFENELAKYNKEKDQEREDKKRRLKEELSNL